MPLSRLLHVHLGRCTYTYASTIQDHLVKAFLASKADPSIPSPEPTILTSEFNPVYTLGRREKNLLTPSILSKLTSHGAEVHTTLRGGQTTFHGPGQLTAYVVLDLKAHNLTPRCYVRMLENALVGTCARYGVKAFTTENTGVWTGETRKIAAVGVHMRRNITSHGIGLNVATNMEWFERIVPCGLEGMDTTSLGKEGVHGNSVEEVGVTFSEEVARMVGCGEVKRIEEQECLKLGGIKPVASASP